MFVGDITCFGKQFTEAQNGEDYDFDYEFEKVKPVFEQADLVVGNLETMVFPNAPYRTEKLVAEQNFHCNAPLEFLDAVRKVGFDLVTNANNHDLDTGSVGIGETIDNVERFGLIQTGTFKSEKPRYELLDVNGIKIAIVAFATEHNKKEENLTVEGVEFLLNNYSKEKAKDIIDSARDAGAEVVFACIHWGQEHKLVHNQTQTNTAKEMAALGYDCIIGSHPHVLQPFSFVETNGKRVPVFYSMGNFISHNVDNNKGRTIIACVELKRTESGVDVECSYIPVFTSGNYGDKQFVVLPINKNPIDPRNIKRKKRIAEIVGDEISISDQVTVKETKEKVTGIIEKEKKKKKKPELNANYPIKYDDGKFVFGIYKDFARLDGFSEEFGATSCTIPEQILDYPVEDVKNAAFAGNDVVRKVNLRKNICAISKQMFKGCPVLEGVQLGRNVTDIRTEAFCDCINLTSAIVKGKVKRIGKHAYKNCVALRTVKIGKSVVEIADDAFEGCEKAIFYCEPSSYAEQYAKEHGFKVVNMQFR